MDWCTTTGFVNASLWSIWLVVLAVGVIMSVIAITDDSDTVRGLTISGIIVAASFAFGLAAAVLSDASSLWGCG